MKRKKYYMTHKLKPKKSRIKKKEQECKKKSDPIKMKSRKWTDIQSDTFSKLVRQSKKIL